MLPLRAVLLLKRLKKPKQWEMLNGQVQAEGSSVATALKRVVQEACGLTVKNVVGTFSQLDVLEKKGRTQINLNFIVSVEEATSWSAVNRILVLPSGDYGEHVWLQSLNQLWKVRRSVPTVQSMVRNVLSFHNKDWHDTATYVDRRPSSLEYQDEYKYIACAAIGRKKDTHDAVERSAILLVRTGINDQGEALRWELPGCEVDCEETTFTVEDVLKQNMLEVTGIPICRITGALREKPIVSTSFKETAPSSVLLVYHVEADLSGEVGLPENRGAWRWIGSEEEAFNLQKEGLMSKMGVKLARLALRNVNACVD